MFSCDCCRRCGRKLGVGVLCWCIVAATIERQQPYISPDLPHLPDDQRAPPPPPPITIVSTRRAPTEANPHFIARPWPQRFAISAAYRSNAATD